jgi:hypothetical protein
MKIVPTVRLADTADAEAVLPGLPGEGVRAPAQLSCSE